MATKTKKNKAGGWNVDFGHEDAQGGGGRVRVPEGDYPCRIKGVKRETSEKSGNPMLVITFVGTGGKLKGKEFRDYFSLMPKALFKLRQLIEALGEEVPEDKMDVKPILARATKNETELGVTMGDEEYENKIRSRPADYLDLETLNEDDEDEDDEDEDDDESEDEDIDEMDRDELKAYIKENELEVRVKKSMDEDDIREAIREAEGDEDDEDEDDEEEEEAPKKKRKKKKSSDDVDDLDLDDL
jgi:hypothetical protein